MKEFKIVFENKRTQKTYLSIAKSLTKSNLIDEIRESMRAVKNHPLRLKSVSEIKKYKL